MGRHPATIGRELERNRWNRENYVAINAQARTRKRSLESRRRHPLKNPDVYAYVLEGLRQGWSPEQIAGRSREIDHPNDPYWWICCESIYRFIYAKENGDKTLWECLPRGRKKRRKRRGRNVHRSRIPRRVSIRQRPEKVNDRTEFGHWEGDTVEGRKSDGDGIHTELERLSRKFAAVKVAAITSDEAISAQFRIFGELPEIARRSDTLDNGRECHRHFELKEVGMETYFADPYSSWQRGSNEHHNGLLRRYLPKGTSFKEVAQEELDDIVWEINNRPRKCLGYNSPEEVFEKQLGVALPDGM